MCETLIRPAIETQDPDLT